MGVPPPIALTDGSYGFTLVRASVRPCLCAAHHIWRSAPQILMIFCTKLHLDESKNVPSGFLKKILVFEILAKNGQFLPFLAIFSQKIRFLDIFFESAHQICLKLGQKLGTVALNHLMTVLCLGKFLFWLFWAIFGSKIHCLW